MIIKLKQEEVQNLTIFLSRVNLTGKEVPAFNNIISAISKAEHLEDNKE